ncbi:hypothetical protein AB0D67_02225 [Streptosporangium sp. NPDC048047]|uniref:hypothetical protein n=1 Tax=Streptosporangium sp. NPDC048047 TaxID=3155748 RepID=UPI00342F3396
MGFDGFLVPDWAKPYVGWAVGMDWPEGDESGCYRLADACAASAKNVARMEGLVPPMGWGDGWDGDALKEHLEYVRRYADPVLVDLVDQLVKGALEFNEMGVQVEYTKRMIEVSVWFLIFQIGWLLVAAVGPWGSVSLAMIGPRVQLARLTIAQLGKKLLINAGLFGGLMGGMDLAVQASQSRRDHLDWAQIGTSAGMGALMGGFLTAFTGFFPTRSMWGLMGRSALASGATTAAPMLFSGEPIDWEMIMKGVTSGALGGADAHWASWGQGAHPIGDGPAGGRGGWGGGHGGPDASPGHVPGKGPDPFTPPVSDGYGPGVFGKSGMSEGAPLSAVKQGADHTGSHLTADPASSVPGKAGWPDGTTTQQAGHHAAQQTGQQTAHQTGHPAGQYADGPATTHTTLSGTGQPVPKPDVVPTSSIDSLINGPHAGDAPAASKPGVGPVNGPIVGAAAGLKVNWTGGNGSPGHLPPAFHSAAQGTVAPHVPGTGTHPGVPSSLHTSQIDALLHRPEGGADSGAHGGASAHSSETTAPAATTHSSAAREPASPFQILADPGLSGDGYIGHGVWGKYGAAGVLIKNVDEHGVPRYLLVQMGSVSPHVGKWQLPGGALDSKETAPPGRRP